MRSDRRVVVTGIGAVTPFGCGGDALWDGLRQGRSAVTGQAVLDVEGLTTKIGASVDSFDPERWIGRKEARRMDRSSQFAVVAACQAIEDSRLEIDRLDRYQVGV